MMGLDRLHFGILLFAGCALAGGQALAAASSAIHDRRPAKPFVIEDTSDHERWIELAQVVPVIEPSRRIALVIGNSAYGQDIGRLRNPVNDSAAMAAALRSVGFEVDLVQDADRDQMSRAVLRFGQSLRESEVGLFYYAGHAVQIDGRNFMVPLGVKLDPSTADPGTVADYVALETVELDNVLVRMGVAEAALNIVILDACRNNPFMQSTRGVSRGLAQAVAPKGTFVAYATSPGKIAEDGHGYNSPYTEALVETLTQPGLQLEDVFKAVRREVALKTDGRQTPWESSSVFGDFFFVSPDEPAGGTFALAVPTAADVRPQPIAVPPAADIVPPLLIPAPRPSSLIAPARPIETQNPIETMDPDQIAQLQSALSTLGVYEGFFDGIYGPETRAAIQAWQESRGRSLEHPIDRMLIETILEEARIWGAPPSKAAGEPPIVPPLQEAHEHVEVEPEPSPKVIPLRERLRLERERKAAAQTRSAPSDELRFNTTIITP